MIPLHFKVVRVLLSLVFRFGRRVFVLGVGFLFYGAWVSVLRGRVSVLNGEGVARTVPQRILSGEARSCVRRDGPAARKRHSLAPWEARSAGHVPGVVGGGGTWARTYTQHGLPYEMLISIRLGSTGTRKHF